MLLIVYKFDEFKSGENQLYKIVTFSLFIQYMQKFTLRRNIKQIGCLSGFFIFISFFTFFRFILLPWFFALRISFFHLLFSFHYLSLNNQDITHFSPSFSFISFSFSPILSLNFCLLPFQSRTSIFFFFFFTIFFNIQNSFLFSHFYPFPAFFFLSYFSFAFFFLFSLPLPFLVHVYNGRVTRAETNSRNARYLLELLSLVKDWHSKLDNSLPSTPFPQRGSRENVRERTREI